MAVKPIKVAQLNGYIKRILQTDPLLGNLSVLGEISNLKFHSSGHVYFTMKDADSKLNCFLPAERLETLRYELAEGMEIIAYGYISLYERGGTYSLNIRDVEVEGTGSLSIAFGQLKGKLEKEGLFDASHKKPLPVFPEKVAVVTAETGAAVRDILKIIQNKNDYVDVLVYPVLVQGPAAAQDIAEGIRQVNLLFPETDVIIAGRGGGSMEELWAFNEEVVARSIFDSEIPVISAVGHEIDITIADLVADRRAETPTAAADMAVPNTRELRGYLQDKQAELFSAMERVLHYGERRLEQLNLSAFQSNLFHKIALAQAEVEGKKREIVTRMESKLEDWENQVSLHKTALDALNPKGIMQRGYSAVLDGAGRLVGTVAKLKEEDPLTLVFADGETDCQVKKIRRNAG